MVTRMRRPVVLVMCSLTGIVTGVSFATSQQQSTSVAAGSAAGVVTATSLTPVSPTASPTAAAPTTSAPTPSASTPAATSTAVPRAVSPTTAPPTTAAAKPAVTVNGAAYQTRFGPVQVQITVRGGRITAAEAIAYPTEDRRDEEINSYAIPELNQEAVDAQSAQIDTVSGATYTSDGYRQSLQSAIDAANKAGAL